MQTAMSKDIRRYFEFDNTTCITTDTNTILTEVRTKRQRSGCQDCSCHRAAAGTSRSATARRGQQTCECLSHMAR